MKRIKPTELLSMDTPSVECEIPQYDCLQDAKTDLVLDQLVQMVHEIKGEIADLREIMTGKGGCNQGSKPRYVDPSVPNGAPLVQAMGGMPNTEYESRFS